MGRPRRSSSDVREKFVSDILILSATLALVASGCSGPGSQWPDFPPEKAADDFPGIAYPATNTIPSMPVGGTGPVWLVGIDGATWDVAGPMIERGELPHLGRLVREGASGVLLSEEPTISPAIWATIATGVPRFRHGIVNFLVKLPESRKTVSAGPLDRRAPAIWEFVTAAGGRSAVVSWFGSYPAESIRGWYVSKGFDPEDLHPGQVQPPPFLKTLAERTHVRIRAGDLREIGKTGFLRETLLDDARTLAALRVIAAAGRPDFVAAYFAGIDIVQHTTWRHMDPASQQFPQDGPPDPSLAGVIPAYYRFIDQALGEIVDLAPEGTTFVVVSDHGGGPLQPAEAYHLQLEVLLEQLGLMNGDAGVAFAIGEMYRNEKRIWLNVAGVEPGGTVEPAAAGRQAESIAARLEGLRTDTGRPVFAEVTKLTGEPGWGPDDPALSVRFSGDALVTETVRDGTREYDFSPVRLRHADVSGSHRLEGMLLLHGPGIRPGRLAEAASIYQIAPTVLYLLGLPQDARMLATAPANGGLLTDVIDPDRLLRQPVLMVDGYPGTDRSGYLRTPDRATVDADPEREEALERLRSLGYIR